MTELLLTRDVCLLGRFEAAKRPVRQPLGGRGDEASSSECLVPQPLVAHSTPASVLAHGSQQLEKTFQFSSRPRLFTREEVQLCNECSHGIAGMVIHGSGGSGAGEGSWSRHHSQWRRFCRSPVLGENFPIRSEEQKSRRRERVSQSPQSLLS